jgi:peptide/nickel transport system substrate-binding protein
MLCGALVAGACGGSSGKKAAAPAAATTTSTAAPTTEDTTASGAGPSSTTTTAVAGSPTTASVSHATTTAAKKKATGTTAAIVNQKVTGGITNVTSTPTTASAIPIQPGGTITYLKASDIASADPIALINSGTTDAPVASAVYDMLVYSDPIAGRIQPQTADSLTSTDATVWTLKLKPNIKFSDGTAYDTGAVKFNWQRLQDPKNTAAKASIANLIASMDVVDAQTLKITLKAKNAIFPIQVAQIPFIGSPTAIQAEGAGFASAPVGAGPFVLKSWVRDSQLSFVRNPSYWNAPRPYVDQLIMKIITDETQRVNTFQSGAANLMYTVNPAAADQLQKGGAQATAGVLNGGVLMYFNVKKPPFNDIRARQAVSLAIDRADFIKVITNGVIEPMDSIFRHTSPFYDASITQPAYDPIKAQQLLDSLAADTGGPLTFTIYTFNAGDYVTGAQYMQSALNKLKNINVSISVEGTTGHIQRVSASDFGAAMYATNFDDPDPAWTGNYTCNASPSPTGFCDTKFDADIADNELTLDPNQRIADLKDAQKIVYAQLPSLWLERRENWIYAPAAVQDVAWANDGLPLFDRLWIKTH